MPRTAAWVLRVGTNLAHDQSRALKRRRPGRELEADADRDQVQDAVTSRIVLSAALARLSRRQREAVVLHFAGDLSIADTVNAMGVAEGTARTHVDRGISELRRLLGRDAVEVLGADT